MIVVRPALPGDVLTIHRFICDLAEFEREPEAVTSTPDQLARALFDGADTPSGRPALFAHVAEEGGEVVGMAIWFLNYSTWTGNHGLYLEDLYVTPESRGRGIGGALMRELAAIAVEHGWDRFQWWVLDWNQCDGRVDGRPGQRFGPAGTRPRGRPLRDHLPPNRRARSPGFCWAFQAALSAAVHLQR